MSDRNRILEGDFRRALMGALGHRPELRLWDQPIGVAWFPIGKPGEAALHALEERRAVRRVRFGRAGMADVSGILAGGRRLEIETKAAAGRPRPDQLAWAELVTRFGGAYYLARPLASDSIGEAVERCAADVLRLVTGSRP